MMRGSRSAAAWIIAGLGALLIAGPAVAQRATTAKKFYDEYEPSRTRQLRSQNCARNEESVRGYCVRACKRGYVLVSNRVPPLCRSVDPLPPGQLPGPLKREVGSQPTPPKPAKPLPPPPPGA